LHCAIDITGKVASAAILLLPSSKVFCVWDRSMVLRARAREAKSLEARPGLRQK
jgi:hypothetical protein